MTRRRSWTTCIAALLLCLSAFVGAVSFVGPPGPVAVPGPTVAPLATSFSFGLAGDFAFSSTAQTVMTSMGNSGLDFVLAAGDLSYGATSEQNWCNFFESKVGDGKVLLVVGNHDSGESGGGNINTFRQYCNFGIPATLNGDYGKEYYFDYPQTSPLARFIGSGCGVSHVYDGTGFWSCPVGDAHYNFVKNAIDSARTAGIPWVVVNTHKTCINSGDYGCEIGEALMDLMLTGSPVDLILQGHYHTYQRSKQLTCADDNNYRPECVSHADTPYVKGQGSVINIAGTGGQGLYNIVNNADRNYFAVVHGVGMNGDSRGFTKYTINDTAISATFIKTGGTFEDSFSVGSPGGPPPPLAVDFTFSPANPIVGQTVTFTATASGGTPPVTFAWTFGDGGTGSGNPATHAYSAAGTYSVQVTATDSLGAIATKSKDVIVTAPPPLIPTAVVVDTDTPDPSLVSQLVTLSGVLTRTDTGAGLSGKTVTFEATDDGGANWWYAGTHTTDANGRANGDVTFTSAGSKLIRLRFDGDAQFAASTSPSNPHTVNSSPPPDFSLVANPTSVSFVSGGSAFSVISLVNQNGFSGVVDLTAASSPVGVNTNCVPASISGVQTSSCTFTSTTPGSYTVTITGTSGSLVHTVPVSVTVTSGGGGPPTPKFCPAVYGITNFAALQAHSSILIDSNALFDGAHGVRSGSGTQADPYIISDWFFDGSLEPDQSFMLRIEKTDKYVTIKNVFIFKMDGPNQWVGLEIGEYPTDFVTKFVTIQNVNVEVKHAYGIGIRGGSNTIVVKDSCVNMDATIDWVYGMVNMRNTQTITFQHNYVNSYTASSTFHTVGIHLSDFWVSDALSATGIVATQNLIENATAAGIIVESSLGTTVTFNKIYNNYPGMKVVAPDYPRGIQLQEKAVSALVNDNEAYKVHWGIQVGADSGRYKNNKIHDSNWGMYVLNVGAWPGISSYDEILHNTVAYSIVNSAYRLPTDHDRVYVVDVPNSGVSSTDFSKVITKWPATAGSRPTAVEYEVKSGGNLWVRVTFPSPIGMLFDVANGFQNPEIMKLTVSVPSGQTISTFVMLKLQTAAVQWTMTNSATATIAGTGFTPSSNYALKRGGVLLACLVSSSTGVLIGSAAANPIATYDLIRGGC